MATETKPKRGCVERIIPWEYEAEAKAIALAENPANGGDPEAPPGQRIALVKRKMWRPGRTLRVRFLDGSDALKQRVADRASEWTRHANLRFEFGDDPRAEIRVSFTFDPGSAWSALGTDALVERYFPRHQPTMSLGWLDDETDPGELSRVVLHEFGHAIGCVHEHQNPAGGIRWNESAVIAHFSGWPNHWDEDAIRFNVLDKYSRGQLNGTEFDPDSIMLYAFPPELTQNGVGTKENAELSAKDAAFIRRAYPAP